MFFPAPWKSCPLALVHLTLVLLTVGSAASLRGAESSVAPSFQDDIIPILTRFSCNAGTCHGKLAGQNGFKLSLRGYAPDADFEALAREGHGRRTNPAAPEHSLLVRKAVGAAPHGGGQRIHSDSRAARTLVEWIGAGMPGPRADESPVVRLEVTPVSRTLTVGESVQLAAVATYADGRTRDVTWLAQFSSGDAGMLEVNDDGRVVAVRQGETIVQASFRGHVVVATFTVPFVREVAPEAYAARLAPLDEHVLAKLAALRIEPAPLCDDSTFLRRAYLDVIGTLPTPEETRAFLADTRPENRFDKRRRLVEELLERPEFVDYWAHWLGDLLQNRKERDHDVRGAKGVRAFHAWIRAQIAARRSWRDIARDVLLARGASDARPAVGYFIVTVGEREAEQSEVADSVAQAFLGVRIGCARCHNHPLEKYTQDDYYHFVGYFSRLALDRKKPEEAPTELFVGTRHALNLRQQVRQQETKLAELQAKPGEPKPIEDAQKQLAELRKQYAAALEAPVQVRQPRTGAMLAPRPLDRSERPLAAGADPREAFVAWMTEPTNEQFSGAMVNRLWKHFLGVALVEPVDDLRATNPPSNRPLWELLNREFVSHDFDLRHLMRTIMNSSTYQRASTTNESNFRDRKFGSHFQVRRLPAEVLLDAICQVTGQPESFVGYPQGIRAIQVPDPFTDSYFLTLFGRSPRTTACACERENDVTLPQLLHLQNGDGLLDKMKSGDGALARLLASGATDDAVLDELFLATLARLPTDRERADIRPSLAGADRREVLTDVLWALVNSKEFTFNH